LVHFHPGWIGCHQSHGSCCDKNVNAFTRTAAYAEFAENSKGTLEPGKFADLAVLSQNIFQVPLDEIPKTESVLTITGGKIAFTSGALAKQ